MKLFRRIAALALAVAVVAMFGISASAAGSNANINGDFGVGATFSWSLTTSEARADAVFYGAEEDYIEFEYQHILIEYVRISPDTDPDTDPDNYSYERLEKEDTERNNNAMTVLVPVTSPYYIQSATYRYDAYYIANGVVDCYLYHGPVTLTN